MGVCGMVSALKCAYTTTWKTAFCVMGPILLVLALPVWFAGLIYNLLIRLWLKVSVQSSSLRVMSGADAVCCISALKDILPIGGTVSTFIGDIDVERFKLLAKNLFACGHLGAKISEDSEFLKRKLDNGTLQTIQKMVCFPTMKYGLYMWKHDFLFDINNHISSTDK
jgi:hypothetical protein